jgi:hypothetical protein
MATLNVTDGTKVILTIMDTASGTSANVVPGAGGNGLEIPTIQDITVSASPGTVNYSTLDSSASSAFTTVNENSISLNVLVDDNVFFGAANASNEVANVGLFQTSKNKTECYFSVSFEGSAGGSNYISGQGFVGGLAPSASIDQAVWISPVEIIVNGELSKGTV